MSLSENDGICGVSRILFLCDGYCLRTYHIICTVKMQNSMGGFFCLIRKKMYAEEPSYEGEDVFDALFLFDENGVLCDYVYISASPEYMWD